MKGYTSIKEYIQDQELLDLSKEIGDVRNGMHIEKLMNQRIKEKTIAQTNRFKQELNKNKFTEFDLKLISVNKCETESLTKLYEQIFGTESIKIDKIKRIINSEAFKQGKLTRIYKFIPSKIDSPRRLKSFLKNWDDGITENELNTLLKLIGDEKSKEWLETYLEKDHHHRFGRRYYF